MKLNFGSVRAVGVAVMVAAVVPWVGGMGTAAAADSSVTVDIGAGSNADKVGTATFTLSATTLTIESTLDDGVVLDESHACVQDVPYTERIAPGQCQFTNTTGNYVITLSDVVPALSGNQVCAQVHYALSSQSQEQPGATAYAGHQDSDTAFFGNVCLTRPSGGSTSSESSSTSTETSSTSTTITTTTSAPATSAAATTQAVSVLPTKIENTTAEEEASPETSVLAESETLPHTGGGIPFTALVVLSLGLLLAGGSLMLLPGLSVERGGHRRH